MYVGRLIYSYLYFFLLLLVGLTVPPGRAATYEVGPGKPFAAIGDVPWATLQPGDTVLIHWRSTPYKEKWVIARQGTAVAPITVSGVPGPAGELPVIDGMDAITAPGLNYWSEVRGVIKIGGSNTPPDTMPKYIIVENLEIINAHQPYDFTDDNGNTQSYTKNASAIYLEKGENIIIRNCIFRNNGNGLFVASSDSNVSRDILIQGNYLYDNGNVGSAFEHNSYTAGVRMTFEYNRYGPPLAGAVGNNLKDRSAGTVVRYNWIAGGNRQLDLVDAEDSVQIRTDPQYSETHVYGNVLIEPDGAGNRQITHYGGDSGTTSAYRKGTLYFFNNTIVSTRTDRNTLLRLSTNDEHCDARNNVFYSTLPGSEWSMLDAAGVLDLSHNWIKPGWRNSFSGSFVGTVNNDGTMVEGNDPGFFNEASQDFQLASGSPNIDAGTTLHPSVLPAHNVVRHYLKHQSSEPRPLDAVLDIGAFEFFSGGNQPPTAVAAANPSGGTVPLTVNFDGSGSSDTDGVIMSYDWDFGDGNTAGGATTNHVYNSDGAYTATLTVTDDGGATDIDTVQIVVDPLPSNNPPTAVATANPTSGTVPLSVQFDGTGSSDSDGTIVSYEWDFGDGNTASGATPNHVYDSDGTYTATLTVTDDGGATDTDTVQIIVGPLPSNDPPTAVASANPTSGTVPLSVQFDGTGSSDSDGNIVSYEWDFGDGNTAGGQAVNHTYTTEGAFTATLTVTDDDGDSSTDTVQIQVDPDVLEAPVLSGSASQRVVSLSWAHPGGADGFYVERGQKKKGKVNWARIATLGGSVLGYTDQPGRGNFYYRVQAFRNSPAEVSGYSNELKLRVR